MNVWLSDLKGMAVATLDEGRILGTVDQWYFDPQEKRLTGLILRTGNTWTGAGVWLEIGRVHKLGADLIFVQASLPEAPGEPQGRKTADLTGKTVSTQDGRNLGRVADLEVESESRCVRAIALDSGRVVVIAAEQTVLGADLVLVQAGAQPQDHPGNRRPKNFWQSLADDPLVRQAKDSVKRWLQNPEANLASSPKPTHPPKERKPPSHH